MIPTESADRLQRRRIGPAIAFAACVLAVLAPAPARSDAPAPGEREPLDTGATERVVTRIVQIDVSVIDPKSGSYASVPGLTLDQFDIRLDWKRLTPEQRARTRLDEFCDPLAGVVGTRRAAREAGVTARPVIVMVDFNYLDAAGRQRVADAIAALAETPPRGGEVYAIYAFVRQLHRLTPGFTADPDVLRRAADEIRQTSWRVAIPGSLAALSPGFVADSSALVARGPFAGSDGGPPSAAEVEQMFADQIGQIPGFVQDELGRIERAVNDAWGDALDERDPRASLAALEALLRAHAHIDGRKVVILFSSDSFTFAQRERIAQELEPILEVARDGYAIWTVDTPGLDRRRQTLSGLLSSLSQDTGGDTVRNTSDLGRAFERASEQLSCYYMLSIPVPADANRTTRHAVTVKLDTERYPELWGLRVVHPARVVVPDPVTRLRNERLAAMISPDDFDDPRVSVAVDFPVPYRGKRLLPIRFRTSLGDLTWLPDGTGGVSARLALDAVVERATRRGREIACRIDADEVGRIGLSLPRLPDPDTHRALTIEMECPIRGDGQLIARGVVTDLESGRAGAGRASVFVRDEPTDRWEVFGPMILAASGRDLLWRVGQQHASTDRNRRAWRTVTATDPARPDDRIALRYALCGPDRAAARDALFHVLVRHDEQIDALEIEQIMNPASLALADGEPGPFCSPAQIVVPEFTLDPGRYGIAVLASDADPVETLEGIASDGAGVPDGLLAFGWFDVAPPR